MEQLYGDGALRGVLSHVLHLIGIVAVGCPHVGSGVVGPSSDGEDTEWAIDRTKGGWAIAEIIRVERTDREGSAVMTIAGTF